MADADKVVEVLIRFGLDKQKAEEAVSELKNLQKQTTENTEEFKLLGNQSGFLLRHIGLISQQSPLLGMALRAAISPEAIGIIASVTAFQQISQLLDEHRKKLEEIADAEAQITTAQWDAQREAINQAASAALNLAAAFDEVHKKRDFKDQEAVTKSQFDAEVEQNKKLIESYQQLELARAGGDKAKEEEIKNRFARIQEQYGLAVGDAKIVGQLQFLREARKRSSQSQSEAEAASLALQNGDPNADAAVAAAQRVAQLQSKQTQLVKARNQALGGKSLEEIEAAAQKFATPGGFEGAGFDYNIIIERAAKARKAVEAVQNNQREIDENNKVVREHTTVMQRLTKAAADAEAKMKADAADVLARENALSISRGQQGAAARGAQARAPINAEAELYRRRTEELQLQANLVKETQALIESGKSVPAEVVKAIQAVRKELDQTNAAIKRASTSPAIN